MESAMVQVRVPVLVVAAACLFAAATASARDSELEHAYRVIAGKRFVDLTHDFGPDTPVWSGFGQAKFSAAADPKTHEPYTIAKDGFRATYYEMVGQYGTHVDPPAHFAENGITMDQIPLKHMILRLLLLDRTPHPRQGPNPRPSRRRSEKLGTRARARPGRPLRRAAPRHVQGLGFQSGPLQARAVPRLGVRNHQISLRTARRHRDRPRSDGHRYDRENGLRDLHPPARPFSDRGHG